MSEREQYPAGVPCWIETLQPDLQATIRFYRSLFGWEFIGPGPMPGDPPGQYYVARVRGRDVAGIGSLPTGGAALGPAWSTYIRATSADDAANLAKRAGGQVIVQPFDVLPAGRMAVLADRAGATFGVWEAKDRQGAMVINEPRAWAMSLLNTTDPEGAKAFYGAVFGWKAEPFGPGEGQVELFRLPGYVGGEPGQPVPRDVVGVMAPIRSGDIRPHWSINFWIDDADAAAQQAAKLGGRVIAPPHDTPGFRSAVLADSQGATFSVSKLDRSTRKASS
jgi:predicted enzyme related to lactoylglutathione lyase